MLYANIHKNAKPEISFHFNNHCVSPFSLRLDTSQGMCVKKGLKQGKNVSCQKFLGKKLFSSFNSHKGHTQQKVFFV